MKKLLAYLPFISILVVLFLQLLVGFRGISFRDEGFLLNNAVQIVHGKVPYRDFFMTTTPGAYYLQAKVFTILGQFVATDRILYLGVITIFLLVLLFFLEKEKPLLKSVILLLAGFIMVNPGGYAFYNSEALVLFLVSVLVYRKYIRTKDLFFLSLSGILFGLTFIFKQSYSVFGLLAVIVLLSLEKEKIKLLKYFLSGYTSVLGIFFLYFLFQGALKDALYYIFIFSQEVKNHRQPFLLTSAFFIPCLLGFFLAIQKGKITKKILYGLVFLIFFFATYIAISPARIHRFFTLEQDSLVDYYLFLLVFPISLIAGYLKRGAVAYKEQIAMCCFLIALFLASAASGRDIATVAISLPLFLLVSLDAMAIYKDVGKKILGTVIIIYAIPLIQLGAGNVLISLNTNTVPSQVPSLALLSIPPLENREITSMTNYIQKDTKPTDTIFCFPYCPLIHVLAERNAASYFSFFYSETIRTTDEERVLSDLSRMQPKLVILQRTGIIESEAAYQDTRLARIKTYITKHYVLSIQMSDFIFYERESN